MASWLSPRGQSQPIILDDIAKLVLGGRINALIKARTWVHSTMFTILGGGGMIRMLPDNLYEGFRLVGR